MDATNPAELAQFADALQGSGRLLGIDLGTKTIGLAISDENWAISSPVRTIKRTKFTPDVQAMLEFATAERVSGIVIGLPLNMDGSEGPRAQSSRAFARNLSRLTELPIQLWDESLSTSEALEGVSAKKAAQMKADGKLDALAASLILQGCCDAMRALPPR
ncbi:Holliday junction resolvase RuvX [Ahrensia sp. R2A130]|uniref:Holliday junction resolvase RuvX n=1 Tax=Ahrensia sp. R2A130 TaxID=744979 RepID=UPI0001E0D0A2|nr:Holliday junction resolvase RuvX [Ahrensia sp. R2A130]EFL90289.1 putative Holliday junction resolvase [Ahrensia sp. R2A130]